MKEVVIDVETTSRGPKKSPGWQWRANHCVLVGTAMDGFVKQYAPSSDRPRVGFQEDTMFIGHNLGFDIGWMYRTSVDGGVPSEYALRTLLDPSIILWDTMLVQYILSAQKTTVSSLSLKKICADLNIDKDWSIHEIGNIESISESELKEYNKKDLENTKKLYDIQLKAVGAIPGGVDFVLSQLRGLKHTIVASLRGMEFNTEEAEREQEVIQATFDSCKRDITKYMRDTYPGLDWNPESNQDLGTFLFGGTKTKESHVPITQGGKEVRFKSGLKVGQLRTHKKTEDIHIRPLLSSGAAKKTAGGQWSVADDVLQAHSTDSLVIDILHMRMLKKDLSTYYKGMIEAADTFDGRIHPSYNHCITATGRLSSSKPNLQNITGGTDD